jgi:predicted DNA-binding transcriptional regulator AlpA
VRGDQREIAVSLEHSPARQQRGIPGIGHNSGLKEFSRFVDLKEAGLFKSRMTCDRAIKRGDFPTGVLMGNVRLWCRASILEALARLPTEKRKREEEEEGQ